MIVGTAKNLAFLEDALVIEESLKMVLLTFTLINKYLLKVVALRPCMFSNKT
jgi:hypothetical protein